MKWFKRTLLSIVRRPGKSFLLFLVVFMMANLLAGSLSVIQTSSNIKEALKESIAPKVSFAYEKYYKKDRGSYVRHVTFDEINQYQDTMDTLKNDANVILFEQHYMLNVVSKFKDCGWPSYDTREFALGLYSTNVIEPTYFKEAKHKLLSSQENRFFTKEELQSDEILIIVDSKLATYQDLLSNPISTGLNEIGNEVTLVVKSPSLYYNNKTKSYQPYEYSFKAKVVGVVENFTNIPVQNCAYISDQALFKIVDDANAYFASIHAKPITCELESSMFSMESIDTVASFMDENAELIDALPEGFVYDSSIDTYKKNVGPVENLDTIATVILVIAILATFVILGLVIIFFINDRKKEMGIYLSVGEHKKHIVLQLVCEIVLVATLAIGCASVSGLFLGDKLSGYMLEVQRYVQRENSLGVPNLKPIYKPVKNGISLKTRDDVIRNYEVKPTMEYFLIIFVVGEVSVLVSTILPMAYLSSLKPKDIML